MQQNSAFPVKFKQRSKFNLYGDRDRTAKHRHLDVIGLDDEDVCVLDFTVEWLAGGQKSTGFIDREPFRRLVSRLERV